MSDLLFSQPEEYLSSYLNSGSLSLILGAGASAPLGLPGHEELIQNCFELLDLGDLVDDSHENLIQSAKLVKRASGKDYLDIIKKGLYKDITKFDFDTANKELLIALSSLIVGSTRGTVSKVLTLNYDSILEWYLETFGLNVTVKTDKYQINRKSDIEIIHAHGFLPLNSTGKFVDSESIVFTDDEFDAFLVNHGFFKEYIIDFLNTNIFLSVGVSDETLAKYMKTYLNAINQDLEKNNRIRTQPFGFALISGSYSNKNIELLKEKNVIPIILEEHRSVPYYLFDIARNALGK